MNIFFCIPSNGKTCPLQNNIILNFCKLRKHEKGISFFFWEMYFFICICIYILCYAVLSCSIVSDSLRPHEPYPPGSSVDGDSPGKNTGVGCHALLQEIFPTQGLNLHYKRILYHLSHRGNPRILEWVAYPFSRDLPDPGIKPGSPAL